MNNILRDGPMFSDEEIIAIARTVEPHDFQRIDPPPQTWNNILAEIEVEIASEEALARRRSQRWFTSPKILSVAAACLLLVGIAAIAIAGRGNDGPTTELVAGMTNEGLPVPTTETAQANVTCNGDGCFVDIELTGLPSADEADLELWIINSDVSDMHSLGLITQDDRFRLPDGVDPELFPIVDISIEPRDGVEAHSGQSVLRGTLSQT